MASRYRSRFNLRHSRFVAAAFAFTTALPLAASAGLGHPPKADPELPDACLETALTPEQVARWEKSDAGKVDLDLGTISRQTAASGVFKAFGGIASDAAETALARGDEEYFRPIFERRSYRVGDGLWLLGIYPHETVRLALFHHYRYAHQRDFFYYNYGGLREDFVAAGGVPAWLLLPPKIDAAALAVRKEGVLGRWRKSARVQNADIQKARSKLQAFCATYSAMRSGECVRAADAILAKMDSVQYQVGSQSYIELSRLDLFTEIVFDDLRYHSASLRLAERLSALVERGGAPGTDLLAVAYASFKEIVADAREAERMARKYLLFQAVLGASIGENIAIFAPEAKSLAFASSLAASAMLVLELRASAQGRSFTLPGATETRIETGKPYHALATMLLTWELIEEGYSPSAAAIAVWAAQVGYQFASKTLGRDPKRAFMVSRNHQANLKIRFDLANAAAGIRRGVEGATRGADWAALSIDELFRLSFYRSRESPMLGAEEAARLLERNPLLAYWTWSSIFRPRTIFRAALRGS